MQRSSALLFAFVATALLAAWACGLLRQVALQPQFENRYHVERAERLGNEASTTHGHVTPGAGNVVILDAAKTSEAAQAAWTLPDYEFSHLGAASVTCSLDLYVIGSELFGVSNAASADISYDGKLVRRITFARRPNLLFPGPPAAAVPQGIAGGPVFLTPLYQPDGVEFTVPGADACRSSNWTIAVRIQHATWQIDRVGVVMTYVPPKLLVDNNLAVTLILAAILLLGLLASAFILFRLVGLHYGIAAVAATLAISALALVTHDQWDFPVWVRFVNLVSFGNGNPAMMWAGTPLWPMMVSIVAPIQMAAYTLAQISSSEITALFLKFGIAQAACWSAYLLARDASESRRSFTFWSTLLSPLALYEVAAGYREPLAALFAIIGMSLALRRRFVASLVLLVAAGSTSESLMPLILLPAALLLSEDWRDRRNVLASAGLLALGFAAVAGEWLTLPSSFAGQALAFRAHSYRYGEGSWLGLLTNYDVVPQWVGDNLSTLLTVLVFGAISLAFGIKYFRLLANGDPQAPDRSLKVLSCVAGVVFAFFLSYRGADISTWWTLFALTIFIFLRSDALNPYPLLLGVVAGACQYAVAGTRDFVSWTYLWPQDRGLYGVLGQPVNVFGGMVIGLIGAGAVVLFTEKYSALFSRATPYLGGLFVLVGFSVTSQVDPLEVVFCFSVATLAGSTLYWLYQSRQDAQPWQPYGIVRIIGSVSTAAATIAFAGGDVLWTMVGMVIVAVEYLYGLGLCDFVLGFGTLWLMKSQAGVGWLSFYSYAILLFATVGLILLIAKRRGVDMKNSGTADAG